jgi:catechol 2,3-dioxygenase
MNLPQPVALSPHRIDPRTLPGHVHLKVASLENQLLFYQNVLRLELNWREGASAGLGVNGRDLVRLTQIPNGKRYRGVTGIYHFAILFPNRRELARAIARLFALKWPNSPTDHVMTKTTYTHDAEGNEIELYCESPEDGIFVVNTDGSFYAQWADGRPSDGREPLDLEALFSHLKEEDRLDAPLPPQTDAETAEETLPRIETLVRLNNKFYGEPRLSLSVGIATARENEDLETVMRRADDEMYRRKREYYRQGG